MNILIMIFILTTYDWWFSKAIIPPTTATPTPAPESAPLAKPPMQPRAAPATVPKPGIAEASEKTEK